MEGCETGLQEKLGNGIREDKEKKREIDIFQVFGENAIAKHKETNRFPALNRG